MQLAAEPVDLAGLVGQRLVAPAVGDGAQQGDQRGRGGQDDPAGGGVLEQAAVGLQRGRQERLAGHEQHHELRGLRQGAPVALRGRAASTCVRSWRACRCEVVGALRRRRRCRWRRGTRRAAPWRRPPRLRPPARWTTRSGRRRAVRRARLLGEVAAVHQAGQLDRPAQVQLAPAAAHLRLAAARSTGTASRGAGVGGVPHVGHLLAELALPGRAGRVRGRAPGRCSRSRPSRITASPAARSCSASTAVPRPRVRDQSTPASAPSDAARRRGR